MIESGNFARWARCVLALPFAMLVPLFVTGCGTLGNGRGWGQDALCPLDAKRIARAACDAFFDWQTLVPLAGAAVFSIDDFDDRVSDWAARESPIFGSVDSARNTSDSLVTALQIEALATALVTPSGDDPQQWAFSKAKGLGVEFAAVGATGGVTSLLKVATGRRRPDGSNNRSFPSGHASSAFSAMTLSNRNLDSIDLDRHVRSGLKIGNAVMAAGVAWARVEGERHYPSDVLVGAALGHFLTAFIHDAFLNLPEDSNVGFAVFSAEGGGGMELSFCF
ncbi:MAG: phosphatase PAP2 family protein [Phycisphaerales bacterium]|nr:MAG: phosphatase PAP2 family protein [Phycisphaerales bacterium]